MLRPVAAAALALALIPAQDARKDRLRENLRDTGLVGPWIYDDVEAGFAEAKKGGRPVLVVFR